MPLINVTYPGGALNPEAKKLKNTLWSLALRWEGIEASDFAASIAWIYLEKRPREQIGVGG